MKLSETAFVLAENSSAFHGRTARTLSGNAGSDSEDEDEPDEIESIPKMMQLPLVVEESDYSSSDEDEESGIASPIPDDTNSNKLFNTKIKKLLTILFIYLLPIMLASFALTAIQSSYPK